MSEKYDIFISYRRSSFESAQMIATSLKAKGYKVFLDVESLRGGKFNSKVDMQNQILNNVEAVISGNETK